MTKVYEIARSVFGRQVGPNERIVDACREPHQRVVFAACLLDALALDEKIFDQVERRDSLTFARLGSMIEGTTHE